MVVNLYGLLAWVEKCLGQLCGVLLVMPLRVWYVRMLNLMGHLLGAPKISIPAGTWRVRLFTRFKTEIELCWGLSFQTGNSLVAWDIVWFFLNNATNYFTCKYCSYNLEVSALPEPLLYQDTYATLSEQ